MRLAINIGFVFILALTSGCSGSSWQTNDISGMMPPLAFTLTNQDGRRVTAADYRDKANLVFFGFTSCPHACPTTLSQLAKLMSKLNTEQLKRIEVLFVSVDPDRDSAAKLKQYTANFGANVIGLTGTQDQLQELTKRYRVTYGYGEADAQGNYAVSHAAAVYGFAPGGEAKIMIQDMNDDDAVLADLKHLVKRGR